MTDTVEEALAVGLVGVDASRRVGWAKAFAALARVESLEEEVRQTRDERAALRAAYSRLVGFVQDAAGPRSPVFDEEMRKHFAAERSFRRLDAFQKGQALAREHNAIVFERSEQEREEMKARKVAAERARHRLACDAVRAGHSSRVVAVDSETFGFTCCCGLAHEGSYREILRVSADHDAETAHGVTYRRFRRTMKRFDWKLPYSEAIAIPPGGAEDEEEAT